MTAHAVGSLSAVPVSPKGAPKGAAQGSAGPFEHQLHAARQHRSPASPDHADTHQARAGREIDPARDRRSDSSPSGPDAHDANNGKTRMAANRATASGKGDPAPKSPASSAAHAPAPSEASAAADTVANAVSSEATMAKKDVDGDEQDAGALVGAMLALIGPATAKVLTLGAAAGAAMSAKSVAAAAAAAAMLQAGDVATTAATAEMAPATLPAQLFAAEGLSLNLKKGTDDASTRLGATPTLMLPPATIAAPATPVSVAISAPVGSHGFAPELGQQVAWFVGQDIKQARIRLHPEELGSLDLKISVNNGRVDVVFHAQHPGAVTAVQQSLPQLGQMLAQHGLSLGNAEVGQRDRGDQSGRGGPGDSASEVDEIHGTGPVTPLSQLGLLDAFA